MRPYDPSVDDRILTASRDELTQIQTGRLHDMLTRVYANVPFYRERFDAEGVSPEDFNHPDDLSRFPFTNKQNLRDAYPFGLLATPREDIRRLHASSGTTGQPTVVGYTQADIDTWADIIARCLRVAGCKPGMIAHVAAGYGLFTGGLGFHYGAERLGCTVVPASTGATERQVQLILDLKPDILMPTPSYMLVLLDEFRRRGIDPSTCSLRFAICGAEPWTDEMRSEIEAAFDLHAIDAYGLSEIIGPGVAIEDIDNKRNGMNLWEDHFYPEIIDPASGKVLPDGEEGELVLTSLTKEGMPLVRYRTRDLTRLMPPGAFSVRRMQKVSGRSDDMMIISGVNVFPMAIETQILKCADLSPHYEIEIHKRNHLDRLRIKVEIREDAASALRTEAARELRDHVRSAIGIGVEVEIVDAGTLARSAGKAKRVRDLRED